MNEWMNAWMNKWFKYSCNKKPPPTTMNDSYLPNCTESRKRELGSSPLLGPSGCGAMGGAFRDTKSTLWIEGKGKNKLWTYGMRDYHLTSY
jgi:hypothetical protein